MENRQAAPPASFLATLADLRNGRSIGELDEALGELVAAVRRTGRGGQLVFRLVVKPFSKGKTDEEVQVLALEDAVVVKAPQLERGATPFFSTAAGELGREDPRQAKLPLEPPAPARPVPVPSISDSASTGRA